MSDNDPAKLLERVYVDWDLITNEEQELINSIDDKLNQRGDISPLDIKIVKRVIKYIRDRKNEFQD